MHDSWEPDFDDTPAAEGRTLGGYSLRHPHTGPVVTVVTPFFNTDPTVFMETARSVFRQSLQQIAWLIVDDGSTRTDSLAALDSVGGDPRVTVLRQRRNRGLSAARNAGFEAAETELVLQLDSDDLIEPTAAEKWLWCLTTHPRAAFCKGFSVLFGGQNRLWRTGFHSGNAFLVRNQTDPTAMVRRSVHRAVGGYEESNRSGLEDWDFWLRCADAGYWGATIPEFLSWYRWTGGATRDRWENWDEGPHQRSFRSLLRTRYPALWKHGIPGVPAVAHADGDLKKTPPCDNTLRCESPGVLVLLSGSGDAAEAALLRCLRASIGGPRVSLVSGLPLRPAALWEVERLTSDVFALPHFLSGQHQELFVEYLVRSRGIETVLVGPAHHVGSVLRGVRATLPGVKILCLRDDQRPGSLDEVLAAGEELRATDPPMRGKGSPGGARPSPIPVEPESRVLFASKQGPAWRDRTYGLLVLLLDPPHRWLLRRGVTVHERLVDRVIHLLLRTPT